MPKRPPHLQRCGPGRPLVQVLLAEQVAVLKPGLHQRSAAQHRTEGGGSHRRHNRETVGCLLQRHASL